MKPRILINTVLVAGVLALAVFGAMMMIRFRRTPEPSEPVRSVVRVVAPKITARDDYPMLIEGFGSTRASVQVQIVPEVLGKVIWRSPSAFSGEELALIMNSQQIHRPRWMSSCSATLKLVPQWSPWASGFISCQ